MISVPVIQAKMLHSLGNQYGVEWDKQAMAEFTGTLGASVGLQYLGRLGVRQLVKFIPVYGQTVGATTTGTMSFGSTFAIGRVACMYLYHKSKGEPVTKEKMQAMYENAFDSIKGVAESEARR